MSLFETQFDVIDLHLNDGDFGIAKKLNDQIINSIINRISDPIIKKQFIELSEFPYYKGNWAIERAALSSMMNAQDTSVILALSYLKIFADLEYTNVKFKSGPNPEILPDSFGPSYRRTIKKLPQKYKDIFSIPQDGRPIEKILLAKYHEDGSVLTPELIDIGDNLWTSEWPKYESENHYNDIQINNLKDNLLTFNDTSFKNKLIDKRSEALDDGSEYSELNKNAQLKNLTVAGFPSKRKKFFQAQSIKNSDGILILVNVEDNYEISVDTIEKEIFINNNKVKVKSFNVIATLNPDLKTVDDNMYNLDGTKKHTSAYISGGIESGISNYESRLLPTLIESGIDALVRLNSFVNNGIEQTRLAFLDSVNKNFEFMDPSIKNRSDGDPLKDKYYIDGKMIFDGETRFNVKNFDINLKIEDAVPYTSKGSDDIGRDPQMQFANTLLAFMSIPVNTYTKLLENHKNFMLDLMDAKKAPVVYEEFQKMEWLEKLVEKDELLSYMGSNDGTIEDSKLFEPPSKEFSKSITDKGKMFYEELINKYIEQVSAVYNIELKNITL